MTIKAFDKQNLKTLRIALDKALAEVGKEHGLALTLGMIHYDANQFRTKLEAKILGDGKALMVGDKVYDSLTAVAASHGYGKNVLSDADLGKTFMMGRKFYTILGGQLRAYKFGVLAKDKVTGKVFKFPVNHVAQCLGREFKLSLVDKLDRDTQERV